MSLFFKAISEPSFGLGPILQGPSGGDDPQGDKRP